eukprot:CAMPEP_0119050586 /NCGR_PEP_ID=MMETSP1177-20130426/70734_1 /TAXON_ID=2985 /ORGANISM="Ochromonas sp, Strain CCMP1899" /LENGTH=830 /DNA_ID=CAMNT_0007029157 /DNA_START=526 /DNA_END=3015 /DNA_ORIENTATION=+
MGSKDLAVRVFHNVNSKKMSLTVLTGHRDRLVGAYFSKDGKSAYTVARDGAVFTWKYELVDVIPSIKDKKRSSNMDDHDDNDDYEDINDDEEGTVIVKKKGTWKLVTREFLWEPHTQVTSVAFNKPNSLLVVGFNKGVFGLYEMPGCVNIHKLSVSHHSLNTACINSTGEWLALGSTRLGQLLVWEWQSETYVLKQQGHLYGITTLDFSSDGQYIATGGEDSKVKLWNASSGFCFVTFSEHVAPVTAIRFVGKGTGKAVLSCSLDGTVRAHDLLRYRNFRTLTTPTPVQLISLAVDSSGEIVCAGSLDPFDIYVWSLQTGRLLDILSGHEGPIACLDFSLTSSTLASGSWDGTLKLWDVYKNTCIETLEHGCDVLAVAFRPDGKEICAAATNGNLHIWDVEEGIQVGLIEGQRDIVGGRNSADMVSSANASRSKHFTTVTYTADGSCVLAGGLSKYVCIYSISSGALVKKFQLSHNRSLEGIVDDLRSDQLVDGIATQQLSIGDSDDEFDAHNTLPGGGKKSTDGSRSTRPTVLTTSLRFSPTGREWAAATTQGLQIFSLDESMQFAPTDLDVSITPQSVTAAIIRQEYGLAVNMSLHLGEKAVVKKAVDAVPEEGIDLVVMSLDVRMLKDLLRFLAEEVLSSRHVEYYLKWCWVILKTYGSLLSADSMPYMESIRALIRAVNMHENEIMKMCDENLYSLEFLSSQLEKVKDDNDTNDGSVDPIVEVSTEDGEQESEEEEDEEEEEAGKFSDEEKDSDESEDEIEEIKEVVIEKKKKILKKKEIMDENIKDNNEEVSITVLKNENINEKKTKKRKVLSDEVVDGEKIIEK